MADGTDLFSLLSSRYGLPTALQLLSLFSPDASAAQRGFGAAQLGRTALGGLGSLTGNPALGSLAQDLGPILAGAGAGYGIYNIANNPNYSTAQKAGHSAGTAIDTILSLTVPYYALKPITEAVAGQMERSGSPQIRAGGRQIMAPLLPVEGLLSVLQGDQSPRAAANSMVQQMKQVPVLGGPVGSILGAFGIGTKPTTGTMFRNELGQVLKQIPSLKGLDLTKYNIDPNVYNALSPQARQSGQELGQILAAFAPTGKADPNAYGIQAQNILLNAFGDKTPDILKQFIASQQPQTSTVASTAAPVSQAQAIGWQNPNSIAAIAKRLTAG